ncbi:MAG: CoB--CoM heterodisulfide reductase iron-sulfur subunit B family protein [bacterium]
MKKYALFLGCNTPTKVFQYELSVRWVARRLGVELVDIEDMVCCGSNQINLSIEGGLLLSAMNLALAESYGLDIVTLCAACTGTLSEAVEELKDRKVRAKINEKLSDLGLEYNGKSKVKHFSRIIYENIGIDRIKKEIKKDLSKLTVAPHYGCHYLKPKNVYGGFDEPERPQTLHQLIQATGALPIRYETLLLCCGGKTFPNSQDLAHSLIGIKLENLKNKNVDCISLHCQSCYLMYGTQQEKVSKKLGKQYNIPILLYSQLLGLALGGDPIVDLGLNLNVPSTDKLLDKIGIGHKEKMVKFEVQKAEEAEIHFQ